MTIIDPQSAQNGSRDVQNTSAVPTEASDSSPPGMPPADARPALPPKPKLNNGEVQGDTPAKARSFHANSYRNANLEERRTIAVKEFQDVDLVSVDYFFSHLLPDVLERIETTVEDVTKDLKRKKVLVEDEGGKLTWASFKAKKKDDEAPTSSLARRMTSRGNKAKSRIYRGKNSRPKRTTNSKEDVPKPKEDVHFKPFVTIFDQVVDSAKRVSSVEDLEETHSYRMEPHAAPTSDRPEKMRPDACFVKGPPKGDEGEKTSWYDIACVGEFKTAKKKKDENDNIRKVLYGMHHILATDPCRRFVTGFTIEKDAMALWHGSRSAFLKCKFDYKEKPERLVHLFLAFAFAHENGQETGWDPTVEVNHPIQEPRQYIYYIEGKKYLTLRIIDEHGTDSMLGRGTRVYLVVEVETGVKKVLKDYWVDETRCFEKKIIEIILREVETACGADAADFVRKHIVTVEEEIWVKVGDQIDDTLDVIMHGSMPDVAGIDPLEQEEEAGNSSYKSIGYRDSHDSYKTEARTPQNSRRPFRKMRHRRVVYKEYGTPIDKVGVLSKAVKTLKHVTEVLKYMHKAQWVHRDISAGNVYWYKEGGEERGLLADFEYAKKMNEFGKHEVITGTIYFMAAEAILRKYKYLSEEMAISRLKSKIFFHNAGHDMESVFWVIFYILVNVESKEDSVRKQIKDLLFTGFESSAFHRKDFVSDLSDALDYYDKLLGDDRKDLLVILYKLRTILTRCYRESEANYPKDLIDDSKFLGLYPEFDSVWSDCGTYLAARDIRLKTGPEAEAARTSLKRQRPAESEFTRTLRSHQRPRTVEPIPEEAGEDAL